MDNKETVKRLLGLLGGYKKEVAGIACCLLLSTGLNFCMPLAGSHIMDDGFIGGNRKLLIELVLFLLAASVTNSIINIIKEKIRVNISAGIQYHLSEQSYIHLMKLRVDYFDNVNYAEMLSSINMDVGQMASVADSSVFFVAAEIFGMVGGTAGLFMIDYRLAFLVFLFLPCKYMAVKYFAGKQKRIMGEYINRSQEYAKWFGDSVGGVREIRLFHILDKKHGEFSVKQKHVIEKHKQLDMLGQWNAGTDAIMLQVLSTLVYLLGAWLVFDFQLSVGSVFAFLSYSSYVTGPVSDIVNIGCLLSGIIPSAKRYYAFMELEEEDDSGTAGQLKLDDIRLEHVSFAYGDGESVLKNVSISFPGGSRTVLVGDNGSGKSTVASLLTRLHEPSEGRILLGTKDISELPVKSFRSLVSVVSQQIYLFNDTIENNICLYQNVDEGKLWSVCRDCGLEEFVKEVSFSYMVGQNGAKLSGGQKQKIALARALVHDRPVVILDEATSSTDACSSQRIARLLETCMKGKTVIVITHKKDMLTGADQIVELEAGKVVSIRGK